MKNTPFRTTNRRSIGTITFVFAVSLGLFGQSRVVAAANVPPVVKDLSSSLFDVTRISAATDHDLASSHMEGGTIQRLEFWRRDSARKAQIAASLRRNLQLAVPNLVRDVQSSNGTISTTFKLYNDLNVVCESLESLVSTGGHPNTAKYPALSGDLSEMNRIREELSARIQQTAAILEGKNPELALSGRPKKIIIDDDMPQKPSARKHTSPQ